MTVFDASALLAYLTGEAGADVVEEALLAGGLCSAANWSEVAQKVRAADGDWTLARALLLSFDLEISEVTAEDAEWAAQRWRPREGLSLADRLCLALAARTDSPVLTADTTWGDGNAVRQIR